MNKFENISSETTYVDDELFEKLTSIKQMSAYNYFTGSYEHALINTPVTDEKKFVSGVREKEKRLFFANSDQSPDLSYPQLEKIDTQKIESELASFKKELQTKDIDSVIKKVYLWKINEKIAENRMLQAAQRGDDRKFTKYSSFINGVPDQENYKYTMATLFVEASKNQASQDVLISQAAQRLLRTLSHISSTADHITLQQNNSSTNYTLQHRNEKFHTPSTAQGKKDTSNERIYSDSEIAHIFTTYLQKWQLNGWDVVIDDTRTGISIDNNKILIPKGKKLKETRLYGLIAHEIGVHALRKERGLQTKLKILSIGLDRYKDDEGVAMYEQQKIVGMNDFAGTDAYIAISLALGMDGKKRDFKDVFSILTDYFLMQGKKYEEAQESAWNRCIRTFRGTTGKTPGACFTKDLFYRDGNIGVWNLVKNNPSEVRRFSIGKYDPTNSRHLWILDQLDITDNDLINLEK